MAPPNTQPTLPAEGVYSDLELLFIAEQPKRLWPENQNSNLGTMRKVSTDTLMLAVTQISELVLEQFVATASGYLSRWEEQLGLPKNPVGKSLADRRALIQGRMAKGPFTKTRVQAIVESHVQATFGIPTSITPSGIPLTGDGVTLHSEGGAVNDLYRIYYNPKNFTYEVWINSDVDPDILSLERELRRITPSWMDFTIIDSGGVINYFKRVMGQQPVLYITGGNTVDQMYGNNATAQGGALIDQTSLRVLNGVNDNGSLGLDGTDDYFSIPHASQLNFGDVFTYKAIVNIDVMSAGHFHTIINKGNAGLAGSPGPPWLEVTTAGTVQLREGWAGVVSAHSSINLVQGTSYHIVVTKNLLGEIKIYIDGVDRTILDAASAQVFPSSVGPIYIGRRVDSVGSFLDGRIDELAILNYALSAEEVLQDFNDSKNIL